MPSPFFSRQSPTPYPLRLFLWSYGIGTILVTLLSTIFRHLRIPSPDYYLALSLRGIQHGFVWQFLTYLWVLPSPFSFMWVISFLFTLYLLWLGGKMVTDLRGSGPFLRMVLLSSLFGGAISLIVMPFAPSYLASPAPALYATLTAWMVCSSEMELSLFLVIPVRLKWLITILIGITVLSDLSTGNYVTLTAYLAASLFSYSYALLAWNLRGPFPPLHPLDDRLIALGARVRRWWHRR